MGHRENCRQVSFVFSIIGIILLVLKINFGFLYFMGALFFLIKGEI